MQIEVPRFPLTGKEGRPWQPSCWGLWTSLGAVLGAVAVGGLAFLIGYVGSSEADRRWLGAVTLFAGILGTLGGTVSGAVSAAITGPLDRRRGMTAAGYAAVAAAVTFTLAGSFALFLALQDTDGLTVTSTILGLVLPTGACTAVAAATGWWIWNWTHRPFRV